MNTRTLIFGMAFLGGMLVTSLPSSAQMSDKAVVEYITESLASGKTKTQIGNELLAKGVTASQIKRLMAQYKDQGAGTKAGGAGGKSGVGAEGKIDRNANAGTMDGRGKTGDDLDKEGPAPLDEQLGDQPSEEQQKLFEIRKMYGSDNPLAAADSLSEDAKKKGVIIFGHNLFDNPKLSFEPNQNIAIPDDYVLGPEDEVIIDIFGMNEDQIICSITPEGRIIIPNVGPVQLSGLTVAQAKVRLRSALSTKYSLGGDSPKSDISVTLGNIRTIQVNILGEVRHPGTYRLSSLSSALNALYAAGGVTPIGSLRNIRIVRGGNTACIVDIYDLLFNGSLKDRIQLRESDMIVVPPFEAVVKAAEGTRRPMLYEAVKGESVGNIIKYAGGFTADAYPGSISVQRRKGDKAEVFTVDSGNYSSFAVCDGDVVTPYINHPEYQLLNRVSITGYVLRPGSYELGGDIATVKQLVEHAGGLLDGAFMTRAQLVRERPDRTLEIEGIAIGAVMNGTARDILLRKNDNLIISSYTQMEKKGDVEITGYVTNPGSYLFADGMTVEDLIQLAGGLEEGASSVCVEVGRRIKIDESQVAQDTIAKVFTYNFSSDLSLSDGAKFALEPNDVVSVRKNPTYIEQRMVTVSGEFTFPGQYTLVANNQRLSDIYKRAGGATNYGNVKAASLKRKISEYERNVRRNMAVMLKNDTKIDSIKMKKYMVTETYTVGISLDRALENPGGPDDIILQDGDELIIPNWTNTVRVQGAVYYPNAVNYVEGMPLSYYIEQAGGWTQLARRGKVYVISMNGKVSVGSGAKVTPGCEVVVPSKDEKKKMTTGEWVAIGTATASMAASIASVVTLIVSSKK